MSTRKIKRLERLELDLKIARAETELRKHKQVKALASSSFTGFGGGSGGFTGASGSKRSLRGWGTRPLDPDQELLPDLPKLVERSRNLFRNNPIATGAINNTTTNVIGPGLKLQSRIDRKYLGLTDEEADAWEAETQRRWRVWAESTECDASRQSDFYELQELAFKTTLVGGEIFSTLPLISRPGSPFELRVQLLEGDRVHNPYDLPEDEQTAAGVEVGKYGEPIAYWIQTNALSSLTPQMKRVLTYGSLTKRPQVLHIFRKDRPGQRRGVPYFAPVIDLLKQISRYSDAALMAAVTKAFFTVFIKTESGEIPDVPMPGDASVLDDSEKEQNIELGSGNVVGLGENESIETAQNSTGDMTFDYFVTSCLKQLGMALEIPYEVLMQHFQSSYSAARAAMLAAWRFFKSRRSWISRKFCQPIYEEWLFEEVLAGRIFAPGFVESMDIRKAWSGAQWNGPSPGQIDPVKETKAAIMRVEHGFSTRQQETAEMNGGDWEANMPVRKREERIMKDAGLYPPPVQPELPFPDEPSQSDGTGGSDNGGPAARGSWGRR